LPAEITPKPKKGFGLVRPDYQLFVSQSKAHFNHDIWRKPEKEDFHSEMQKVGRIYQKLSVHQKLLITSLNSWWWEIVSQVTDTSSRPDEVFYSLDFEPLGEPLTLHHLTLSSRKPVNFSASTPWIS